MNRYWVGGGSSTNWNATGNTNWSTYDGGSNNAPIPVDGDNVFLKSSANCTLTDTAFLGSFDMTGYSGILSGNSHSLFYQGIAGQTTVVKFSGTITNKFYVHLNGLDNTITNFTSGGITLPTIYLEGDNHISSNCVVNQQDALTCDTFSIIAGTWNTRNYAITCSSVSGFSSPAALDAGTSTITVLGSWGINANNNYNFSNATLVLTGSYGINFSSSGYSYGTITVEGSNVTFLANSTIGTLNINNAGASTGLKVKAGTTQTVTNFTTNGTTGSLAKILSTSSGSPFHLSYAGAGHISVDYMSIKDCYVDQENTWYMGKNSTDVSGNTNLIFDEFAYYYAGEIPLLELVNSSYYHVFGAYYGNILSNLIPNSLLNVSLSYTGNETISLLPNSSSSILKVYSGSQTTNINLSSIDILYKTYVGNIFIDLLGSSLVNQDKIYGSNLNVSIIPSVEVHVPISYSGNVDIIVNLNSPSNVDLTCLGNQNINVIPSNITNVNKVAITNLNLNVALEAVSIINKVYGANLTLELLPESIKQVINNYSGNLSIEEVLNSFAQRVIETTGDIDITFVLHSETGMSRFHIPKVCLYGYVRRNPIELNGAIPPELVNQ